MSDLVERLRARRMLVTDAVVCGTGREHATAAWLSSHPDQDCAEAADEIVRLRDLLRRVMVEDDTPGTVDLPDVLASDIRAAIGKASP